MQNHDKPAAKMMSTTAATAMPIIAPVGNLLVFCGTFVSGDVVMLAAAMVSICEGVFSTHEFWETEKLLYS